MPFPPYIPDFVDSSSDEILLTSKTEIERLLGAKGVDLHTDDLDSGDPDYFAGEADTTDENFMEELIQRISSKVLQYLMPRFDAERCSENPTVREIATYWAAHDLSRRRGNEPLYEAEVAENIERLERFRDGSLHLAIPSSRPRVYSQAFVVDNRYRLNPIRVISGASTATVSNQKMMYQYPFFWL